MIRDAAWPSPEFLVFAITCFANEKSINNSTIVQSMAIKTTGCVSNFIVVWNFTVAERSQNSIDCMLDPLIQIHFESCACWWNPNSIEIWQLNTQVLNPPAKRQHDQMSSNWTAKGYLKDKLWLLHDVSLRFFKVILPASILYCWAMIDRWRETGVTIQFRQQLISQLSPKWLEGAGHAWQRCLLVDWHLAATHWSGWSQKEWLFLIYHNAINNCWNMGWYEITRYLLGVFKSHLIGG